MKSLRKLNLNSTNLSALVFEGLKVSDVILAYLLQLEVGYIRVATGGTFKMLHFGFSGPVSLQIK